MFHNVTYLFELTWIIIMLKNQTIRACFVQHMVTFVNMTHSIVKVLQLKRECS